MNKFKDITVASYINYLAVSIFVVSFLNVKNKFLAFFSMLLLATSIFYAACHLSPVFNASVAKIQNITQKGIFCGSFSLRLGMWIVGGKIFIEKPIIGTGVVKNMDDIVNRVKESPLDKICVKHLPSYHNFYVQSAVHLGTIGLFLYIMIFYSILKLNIRDKYYFRTMIIFVSVYSVSIFSRNSVSRTVSNNASCIFYMNIHSSKQDRK